MEKERFCLLLLEPGEIYFEDFSGLWLQKGEGEGTQGRLKLCSRSVVFEPRDVALPLTKLPLQQCPKITLAQQILTKNIGDGLEIECKQVVQMLEGNILAPYTFLKEPKEFIFVPTYVSVDHVIRPLSQLHRAASLPHTDHSNMVATIVFSRQSRYTFDPQWLEDFSEQIILELTANKVSPLVNNPGRIVLTNAILYYQPFNNIEKTTVLKIRLNHIRRITKRRFLLRHLGLEIECCPLSAVSSIYLSFQSPEERDNLAAALLDQDLQLDDLRQNEMTLKWQNGVITNFEYLDFLNSLADRSASDLTQYPIFPWVISDFESETLDLKNPLVFRNLKKPVGALNAPRLKKLLDRYEEMDPPKFLYGSHYSAPGLVLFYLVRQYPHLMLCLQNGRFDHPDRMFNSMKDVWRNVNTNMSDFKELTPEFYDPLQEGKFCTNLFGINFGHRHDGTKVNDVELPPWANGSAKEFVSKMREALESDLVSKNLHHWIDIIFGCKQTGEEAVKAHNIFYPMCYEGNVDLSSESDFGKRHALEVQIMEFGQIPKQLFTIPHPSRLQLGPQVSLSEPDSPIRRTSEDADIPESMVQKEQLQRAHRDYVSGLHLLDGRLFSAGHDGALKVYKSGGLEVERNATLSSLPLSCCMALPGASTVLAACWDNNLYSYEVEFGRKVELLNAHEDAVTCLQWRPGLLASGSWDCSVRLWRVDDNLGKAALRGPQAYIAELPHENKISSISVQKDFLLSASEGEVFLWDINNHNMIKEFPGHNGDIVGALLDPECRQLVTCGGDRELRLHDLASGMQVYCKTLSQQPSCVAWQHHRLLVGTVEGILLAWDLRQVRQTAQLQAHQGSITAVCLDEGARFAASGGADKSISLWSFQTQL